MNILNFVDNIFGSVVSGWSSLIGILIIFWLGIVLPISVILRLISYFTGG